ncbi:MAG: PAS domain S-box protein [Syntrophobacteraceae bacterium]
MDRDNKGKGISAAQNSGKAAAKVDTISPGSPEEFRAIFENSQIGIMLLKEYRLVFRANQRLADILGYESPEELTGMSVRGMHLSEERFREYGERHYQRLTQGVQIQVEYQLKRKNGSAVWCSLSGKAIDSNSPPDLNKGVIWCVEDISRHKAAEDELAAQRETLVKMIAEREEAEADAKRRARELDCLHKLGVSVNASLSPPRIISEALRGMMEAVEPDLAFFFSLREDQLVLEDVLPPQARKTLAAGLHCIGRCLCGLAIEKAAAVYSADIHRDPRCTLEECKQYGMKSLCVLPVAHGGELLGVLGLGSAAGLAFESRAGFLETMAHQAAAALSKARLYEVALREVSDRKRAEEASRLAVEELRVSERRLRKAEVTARIGNCEFTLGSDTISASEGARAIYGLAGSQWSLHEVQKLPLPQYRPLLDSALQELIQNGKPYNVEFQIRRGGDGKIIDIHSMAEYSPELRVVFGVIQDISQRKRFEEEREQLQAQLIQAQRMESVGRLAGGVAHDFNNMLGVILGHTELALLEVEPPHAAHKSLQEILKAAHRSANLTRQLLAFARKQTISPRVIDLNQTVEGMLTILRRLIGEDIDLAWIPGRELWPVKIDPGQIDQILANLCVNARDAISGIGKITIETATIRFDDSYCARHAGFIPGEFVMLAVSDNGRGMDDKMLEFIFDPFFTTKEVGKGTGLGLATVYGIVKQNKGFINVYSEPGFGTTFKIYIPRVVESVPQKPPALLPKDLRGVETVLLVEDEEQILDLAKTILQQHGYQVLATANPVKALGIVIDNPSPIHLLITDVVMPEMNGKDLKDRIARTRPGLKTIFTSGYTANVIAHHGVLDEGIDFLQKPFSVQDLLEKVREVLDR